LDYLNEFIYYDLGFNIFFEHTIMEKNVNDLITYMSDNIGNNAAYIVGLENRYAPYAPTDLSNYDRLRGMEPLLGDFYDIGMEFAPGYMTNPLIPIYNKPDTLDMIPVSRWEMMPRIPAVLVREDIANHYGRDINTASDYIALLKWIRQHYPDSHPGAVCFEHYFRTPIPFDLFLPENGYWNPQRPDFLLYELGSNEVHRTFSLPEGHAALTDFEELIDSRLLRLVSQFGYDNMFLSYAGFPTVLMYADSFHPSNNILQTWRLVSNFDASEYRMHLLYDGLLPALHWPDGHYMNTRVAVGGQSTNMTDLFRFLQWLDDKENYMRLFYGIENVDYTMSGNRIELIESEVDRGAIRSVLSDFIRTDFEPIRSNAPLNYEESLASYSFAYEIHVDLRAQEDIRDWHNNMSVRERVELLDINMGELYYWNLIILSVQTNSNISSLIVNYLRSMDQHETKLRQYKNIMSSAMNFAEIKR
jgi:hypothetical protein